MAEITRLDNQQLQRLERRLYGIETAIKALTGALVPTRKTIIEEPPHGSS